MKHRQHSDDQNNDKAMQSTGDADKTLPHLHGQNIDKTEHSHHGVDWAKAVKLMFCAGGILLCYFYFGIAQESITKSRYGPKQEIFEYTQALVFVQCVINCLFAYTLIKVVKPEADNTPSEMYALCSFSYLAAMIASNHALQFVPYPTQVLGKSIKPIPIMVFGVLFARRRYPTLKYVFVLMIVAGCAVFLYKDKKAGNVPGAGMFDVGWGEALLLISLAMDGTTGAVQERIRASYKMVSHHIMFNMNLWSTLYLSVALMLTGEVWRFFEFVDRFPEVIYKMVGLSIASALGQFFIFKTIENFGPLPCSIITTTRKIFTVLISVLYFRNPLSSRQWLGTALIFAGLVLDMFFSKGKPKQKPESVPKIA